MDRRAAALYLAAAAGSSSAADSCLADVAGLLLGVVAPIGAAADSCLGAAAVSRLVAALHRAAGVGSSNVATLHREDEVGSSSVAASRLVAAVDLSSVAAPCSAVGSHRVAVVGSSSAAVPIGAAVDLRRAAGAGSRAHVDAVCDTSVCMPPMHSGGFGGVRAEPGVLPSQRSVRDDAMAVAVPDRRRPSHSAAESHASSASVLCSSHHTPHHTPHHASSLSNTDGASLVAPSSAGHQAGRTTVSGTAPSTPGTTNCTACDALTMKSSRISASASSPFCNDCGASTDGHGSNHRADPAGGAARGRRDLGTGGHHATTAARCVIAGEVGTNLLGGAPMLTGMSRLRTTPASVTERPSHGRTPVKCVRVVSS